MLRSATIVVTLCLITVVPAWARAQQSVNLASVSGRVTDQSGGVVPGAEITARHLETARTQIAGTVTGEEASSLPMNGRNFLELALLVPGVSPTNVSSAELKTPGFRRAAIRRNPRVAVLFRLA